MQFFNNLKNSIYSPTFYQELLAKPFSFSFKYFTLFSLLLAVVMTAIFSFTAIPAVKIFVEELGPEIINYYPAELQVTVDKGLVSTNVAEPYILKIPQNFKDNASTNTVNKPMPEVENFLVIDTKNDFSLENFYSYKTFALLTKDSIISYKNNGINIQPIDKSVNFVLDKNKISDFYNVISPFFKIIYPVIILFIFIAYIFLSLFQFVYLFFGALIVWLASKIKGVKTGYKKAYQMGLHLLVPVIVLEMLLNSFKINLQIPFLFTIVLFVLALINIKKLNEPMKLDFKSQSGQVVKLMLALIIVCLVAIAIAYIVIKSAEKPAKVPVVDNGEVVVPKAVYEVTTSDIKITFQEAFNYGGTLKGSQSINPSYQKDVTTTEKYILVTIGGQNKGKTDTPSNVWDLGNIIDSDGRNFIPNSYETNQWLPKNNGCGDVLKPEFTPTSCSKIYEVAKGSSGLKVEVLVAKKDGEKYETSKKETIILDLIVNNK